VRTTFSQPLTDAEFLKSIAALGSAQMGREKFVV
jgi:hypothetical protein